MFERFTESARRVVVIAQEQAEELDCNYIGTEHLALGLIMAEEKEAAPPVLTALGVSRRTFKEELAKLSASEPERRITKAASVRLPFTPRAKKVIELAQREAMSFGHNYVGVEHILLGFVRENEGVGVRVLDKLEVDWSDVRSRVTENFRPGSLRTTDPLEALKLHVRRVEEQLPLIEEQTFINDTLRNRSIRRIRMNIRRIKHYAKELDNLRIKK